MNNRQIPSPQALGFHPKFKGWRPQQVQAVNDILSSPKRAIGLCMPTGGGKTATYVGAALLKGGRFATCVTTKGLADQLLVDFRDIGLKDVRGKSSYECVRGGSCEEGSAGKCKVARTIDCNHYMAYINAVKGRAMVTNYSCWSLTWKYGRGFNPQNGPVVDTLVLDEAHDLPDHLAEMVQVKLSANEVVEILGESFPRSDVDLVEWKIWATPMRILAQNMAKEWKAKIDADPMAKISWVRHHNHLMNIAQKLAQLALINPSDWVVEAHPWGYQFDPIDPARYGEATIFRGIKHVWLVSATIRPKTLEMVGFPKGSYQFFDYPSTFSPERFPIYQIPTLRIDHKMDPDMIVYLTTKVDNILAARPDRKGIIQTVSFRMQEIIRQRSRFADRMLFNKHGESIADFVRRFKAARPGRIAVTPSLVAGYDFPGDECRFIIQCKMPFPDGRAKVLKERAKRDRRYLDYQTMQQLEQGCGRGMRSQDDWCEVFILDDHGQWFVPKNRDLAAPWFMASYRQVLSVPDPIAF